ncbi:SH3 domain-containing protein [Octadecabacter sp. G9-8]|uniref:SH3 domain-containing protein n=1 Tax=Octadecabacter dasysiphoniae TaxID=2909341 RepID=A0ABS9CX76_9RHOB|nr:SH3 domain-containing protein [Octadecabacter dasysiphoniae]MCF2871857.1 SH3 domain-containing protein [Octadecabacter dasysiphoniae]
MKSYVWLTFAFMGWGYYEMSGGADFVPEQRQVAEAAVVEPEIVARAETTTLLSVSSSNVTPQPALAEPEITVAVEPEVAPEVIEIIAPAVEPKLDIRAVAGSRVNMRMGPGTGFDVITTLEGGTKLEVLSIDAQGWANVSTERGLEGWMAERLLTDPET